jgi:hypothetical protein
MSRIQTGIGSGKTEVNVTTQEFMQECGAGTPEPEDKERSRRRGCSNLIRKAFVLNLLQYRLNR